MAASRDKWLVAMVCVTAVGVAGTIGLLVTEKQRSATVSKLRTKTAAALSPFASESPSAGTPSTSGDAPGAPEKLSAGALQPERIARFEEVFKKRRVMHADPSREEMERILGLKPEERTEADLEKIEEYLAGCRDLILELRRLAESGGPVYELDFSKGFEMELPHLAQLRDCARLLAADALLQARAGRYDEAAQDLLAAMKLADALTDEPILISQLVRIAMDGIVYSTVSGGIPGGKLPPEVAREIIQYASGAGHREAFANSFNGEGFFGLDAFEDLRSGNFGAVSGWYGDYPWDGLLMRVYGSPIGRPWLNMDEEAYASIIGRMGEIAPLPYYEAKPLFEELDREIQSLSRTRVLTRTLLPALTRAAQAQAQHEACLGLMSLGLAVEQYHAQNGQYPATLNEVAAMFGGSLPIDPFTGGPYGYESSGGSCTLYSRMGSVIDTERLRRSFGVDAQGNVVWRRPAEQQ